MVNMLLVASLLVVLLGLSLQVRNGLHRRPCSFIWAGLFLALFVLMPLLTNLFYGLALGVGWNPGWIEDPAVYLIYGSITLSFSLGYLLVCVPWRSHSSGRTSGFRPYLDGPDGFESQVHVAIGCLVILGAVVFLTGTGVSPLEILRGGRFVYYGLETFSGPALLLGLYLVGLVAVYAHQDAKGGFPRRWFSLVVYSSIPFMMIVGGGRKWLFFAASGWLAGSYDRRGALQVNLRVVGGLSLLTIALVGWQVVRAVGWLDPTFVLSLRSQLVERLPTLLWEGDASYFFRASMEAIRLNVSHDLLYPLALVRRLVFLPLPDELTFGLKPPGIPMMFAEELNFYTSRRMGNLPPGLFGVYVLSFGWRASMVIGPALTYTAVWIADWLVRARDSWIRDVVFASFLMVALLFMRGSEGGLYFLAFNLVAVGITRKLMRILARRPRWAGGGPRTPEAGGM